MKPRLILITDWSKPGAVERLRGVASLPGVAIQHRNPLAQGRELFEQGKALMALKAQVFVNGRLDVALALGAHLHLPAHGVAVKDVRALLPVGRWLSVAVHDEAEALSADGADLALVSPVFTPGSKPNDTRAPLGAEGFARLKARLPCPAFALGGMSPERTRVLSPWGVATVTGVQQAAAFLDALGTMPAR